MESVVLSVAFHCRRVTRSGKGLGQDPGIRPTWRWTISRIVPYAPPPFPPSPSHRVRTVAGHLRTGTVHGMDDIVGSCRWCGGLLEWRGDTELLQNLAGNTQCSFAPVDLVEGHHQLTPLEGATSS